MVTNMMILTLIMTAVLAMVITSLLGIKLIPYLKRLHFGQTIKEIGPKWHAKKQGTPVMGGLMFWAGIIVAAVIGYLYYIFQSGNTPNSLAVVRFISGLFIALAFGMIGFLDDYIKVVKKRNLGLNVRQKTVMQLLICIAYVATLYLAGDTSTVVIFPFLGQIDFGIFYYPLAVIGIYFFVNAANLTDGVDGLLSSVTFVVSLGLLAVAAILRNMEMQIYAVALAGGCLGFLFWNFHPAKCFMGDTGSMFLGGIVVAACFGLGMPVLLGLVGIIYLVEAMSVVLQVISFKTTGKRIFKMSPIHHHFEMSGWSEVKIVFVFSAVTAVFCVIAVIGVWTMPGVR